MDVHHWLPQLKNGHVAVVQELLAPHNAVHNIEVNKAANNGCTPLVAAAQNGHVAVVEELLAPLTRRP